MPVILSSLIIIVAAIGGWLLSVLFIRVLFRPHSPKKFIGFRLHGIVPALLPGLAAYASRMVQDEFLSEEKIAAKLDDPALMQQLKPDIEAHIDEFLATKLKEAFPLLSNFMGEKTLLKFKAAFLTEVETILPDLLKRYSGRLLNQWQPHQLLAEKIRGIDIKALEQLVQQQAAKQVRCCYLAGALLGGLVGAIQVLIIYLY
ncbi:MAG: hypothetical protein H7Y86_04515 [Rhizobacter sp.]|nr:hypothetical protein [Ferruginibacter sp.]